MSNLLDSLRSELRKPEDVLSSFLSGVKPPSNTGWISACCPFHADNSPSLSVNSSSGGWKCFACDKSGSYYQLPGNPGTPKPVSIYEYNDEETGTVEYIKVRYFPKTFKHFTVAASGELIAGKLSPKSYLFNWYQVKDKRGPLYVVEGEKDVQTLCDSGIRATTAGGSSQWNPRFKDLLASEEVYLIPDNDEPGRRWAEKVQEALGEVCRGIIEMPSEDIKDITDWYNRGFKIDQLEVRQTSPGKSVSGIGLVDMSRLEEPKARPKVWGELVPDNVVTVLYADGGVGKSLFTLILAHYLALGQEFLGIPVSGLSQVAFFDWELNLEEHSRRSYQVSRGMGLLSPPPGLWYMHPEKSLQDSIEDIITLIRTHKIRLAVIDSLGPACGGDTNNAETIINFYQQLLRLGIPVIVIDHQSKPSQDAPNAMKPYGSVYKWNLARSVVKLERRSAETGKDTEYTLMQLKNNFGPLSAPVHFKTHFDQASNSFSIERRIPE